MTTSTDGIINPDAAVFPRGDPGFDSPANIARWEVWVRAQLLQWELGQGISFEATAASPATSVAGASTSATEHSLTMKVESKDTSGTTTIVPIFKLCRPTTAFFQSQIKLVQAWGELRLERAPEILSQIDHQFPFVASITGLHLERHRWTTELLSNAIQFTVLMEMQFKHVLGCWRPFQYSDQIQPMLTTPGHGSFPSGHSTQAFMLARLLVGILGLTETDSTTLQLYRQAARIATNRVVAGLHFPADSVAGRMLGHTIAEYILARLGVETGGSPTQVRSRTFAPTDPVGGSLDLDITDQNVDTPHAGGQRGDTIGDPVPVAAKPTPVLAQLYAYGEAERKALTFKV